MGTPYRWLREKLKGGRMSYQDHRREALSKKTSVHTVRGTFEYRSQPDDVGHLPHGTNIECKTKHF